MSERWDAEADVDQNILDEAKRQLRTQTLWFQRLQMMYLFTAGHTKGHSLEELASRTGIDATSLRETLGEYNGDARAGQPDRMGKDPEHVRPIEHGPCYAFDCSLRTQRGFPCPMITLGGLTVEERTGAVTRKDGTVIPGLYAVGRNAVGICSESYVSGLAIADCVFSGRRAGVAIVSTSASGEDCAT